MLILLESIVRVMPRPCIITQHILSLSPEGHNSGVSGSSSRFCISRACNGRKRSSRICAWCARNRTISRRDARSREWPGFCLDLGWCFTTKGIVLDRLHLGAFLHLQDLQSHAMRLQSHSVFKSLKPSLGSPKQGR